MVGDSSKHSAANFGKYLGQSDVEPGPCHCRHIYILDVQNNYAKLARLSGHSSTVRSLDWSRDSSTLMSMDQAYETLHWDVRRGAKSKAGQRDQAWESWTNVLGFPVMGIWPPGSDGTDVNAVARSPDGASVLTCDDSGQVRRSIPSCILHARKPQLERRTGQSVQT